MQFLSIVWFIFACLMFKEKDEDRDERDWFYKFMIGFESTMVTWFEWVFDFPCRFWFEMKAVASWWLTKEQLMMYEDGRLRLMRKEDCTICVMNTKEFCNFCAFTFWMLSGFWLKDIDLSFCRFVIWDLHGKGEKNSSNDNMILGFLNFCRFRLAAELSQCLRFRLLHGTRMKRERSWFTVMAHGHWLTIVVLLMLRGFCNWTRKKNMVLRWWWLCGDVLRLMVTFFSGYHGLSGFFI